MLYISTLLNLKRMSLNQQSKVFHNLPIWCLSAKAWIKRQERTIKPSIFWFKEKEKAPQERNGQSRYRLVEQRWTHFTLKWHSPSSVKRSIKRDLFCWAILTNRAGHTFAAVTPTHCAGLPLCRPCKAPPSSEQCLGYHTRNNPKSWQLVCLILALTVLMWVFKVRQLVFRFL